MITFITILIFIVLIFVVSVIFTIIVVGPSRTLRRVSKLPFLFVSARLYAIPPRLLKGKAEGLQVQSFVSWPLFLYFAVLNTLLMLRCGSSIAMLNRLFNATL